jgi:DNA-binding response OmpR family regulator
MSRTEDSRMQYKVLIVDDQQDILDLMKDILEPEGYQVITFMEVEDILVEVENSQPDIVLMDFLLSGINGGEFCAQLKKNAKTGHIPVIFLSANSRVIESLGHYGYDDFIAKPFDIYEVLTTIKKHLPADIK